MIVSEYESYAKRPVKHSAPFFMSEGLYLAHADNLYNRSVQIQPSYPIEHLFIDSATFERWFPTAAEPTAASPPNLSRRVAESDVQFLPITTLDLHAQDMQTATPPDKSKVAMELAPYFSAAELETRHLWQRLDARVAALGGPDKVRAMFRDGLAAYDRQSLVGEKG